MCLDGIGEIGKLGFIASASRSFDSNPKTWKAVGEVLTTIGSGLQLCTLLSPPSYFLPLASGGNIAKVTSSCDLISRALHGLCGERHICGSQDILRSQTILVT